jgi:hypothetical protein
MTLHVTKISLLYHASQSIDECVEMHLNSEFGYTPAAKSFCINQKAINR